MMEALVPAAAVAVETFGDDLPAPLFAEETPVVASAVESRRREFATGRRCARAALARLGFPPLPLPAGPAREPLWPVGIVGSITHCAGYRAAAVARDRDLVAIGIDAEPHEPLPAGVLDLVALPSERPRLSDLGRTRATVHWDRVLFCVKEAVYKAWYPMAGRRLGFEDADVVLDAADRTFTATLLVPGPDQGGRPLSRLAGRFGVEEGLVLAATWLDAVNHLPGRRPHSPSRHPVGAGDGKERPHPPRSADGDAVSRNGAAASG